MGTKYSLGSRIIIPNGADLGEYMTPGSYASQSGDNVIENNPSLSGAFGLDVDYALGDSYYIRQTLKPFAHGIGKYYVRYFSGDSLSWSPWDSFVRTSDLEDLNSKTTLYAINGTSFASVLKGKSNRVTYLAFYHPTDNPFSLSSGYAIAFHSGLMSTPNHFIIVGIGWNDEVIEIKHFSIT